MAVVENGRASFLTRLLSIARWPFLNSRPQFHAALMVLYTMLFLAAAWGFWILIFRLLGFSDTLDLEALGSFFGPLAFGGLVSGQLKLWRSQSVLLKNWVGPGVFGGVSTLVFLLIVDLRWHHPDAIRSALAFMFGAAFFMLLAWFSRWEEKSKAQSAAAIRNDET